MVDIPIQSYVALADEVKGGDGHNRLFNRGRLEERLRCWRLIRIGAQHAMPFGPFGPLLPGEAHAGKQ